MIPYRVISSVEGLTDYENLLSGPSVRTEEGALHSDILLSFSASTRRSL